MIKLSEIKTIDFWKKGSGELLGFICITPILCSLLILLVSIVQIGTIKEKLEYTTYIACRAAVVAENYSDAHKAANQAATQDLQSVQDRLTGACVELIPVKGKDKLNSSKKTTTKKRTKTKVDASLELSNEEKTALKGFYMEDWTKGNYITCQVTVNINAVSPLVAGTRTGNLTMMIENVYGSSSLWF